MSQGKPVKFGTKIYTNADDYPAGLLASADRYVAVTPNDDTDLPDGTCRAFWAGAAGVVVGQDRYGTDVSIHALAGWNPFIITRIKATGTTATGLLAIY